MEGVELEGRRGDAKVERWRRGRYRGGEEESIEVERRMNVGGRGVTDSQSFKAHVPYSKCVSNGCAVNVTSQLILLVKMRSVSASRLQSCA